MCVCVCVCVCVCYKRFCKSNKRKMNLSNIKSENISNLNIYYKTKPKIINIEI